MAPLDVAISLPVALLSCPSRGRRLLPRSASRLAARQPPPRVCLQQVRGKQAQECVWHCHGDATAATATEAMAARPGCTRRTDERNFERSSTPRKSFRVSSAQRMNSVDITSKEWHVPPTVAMLAAVLSRRSWCCVLLHTRSAAAHKLVLVLINCGSGGFARDVQHKRSQTGGGGAGGGRQEWLLDWRRSRRPSLAITYLARSRSARSPRLLSVCAVANLTLLQPSAC